jgi:toluene monooxygenase system protein A
MALLERSQWYDLARTTNWTPKYVSDEELFPTDMTDIFAIPISKWESFDEPYKVSYREYVKIQREKDVGAYSVKAALQRSEFYDKADPGWMAVLSAHYGGVCAVEFGSASTQARMTRFGRGPGMRNMGTFGSLDEIRHTQLQLFFAHELVSRDREGGYQFTWAHKAYLTNNWVSVALRHIFEDLEHTRDAVSTAVMTTFAFETAFTNLQFIALSADASRIGDHVFSHLIQSIQSDEARHAQTGVEILKLMVESGKVAEAQKLVDISFWLCWRQFSVLTGLSMDYYTPLDKREHSFKEFMEEWVITQFERQLLDVGLAKPWYWDIFLRDIETFHHGQQIGVYLTRNTVWWNPTAGVTPAEREWLESKYPGWNDTYGKVWDVIVDNLLQGKEEKTFLEAIPILCHMSNLAIVGVPGNRWDVKNHYLDYEERRYHFASEVDRWIFEQEPARYKGFNTVLDRFVNGEVQPATPEGFLKYMGVDVEGGHDAHNYAWVDAYRENLKKAV